MRIGVLGAARIAERAIADPARTCGHRLVAVAARDPARAEEFAAAHGVERVAESYAALVADPEVDVVYNPLPNGLHGPWNLAALAAGKHVLTEKPSASNAEEAAAVRSAAAAAGTVFMEGFHYHFHPVVRRLHELLESGELGEVRRVETSVSMPAPPDDDVRWSLPLAGGALMDLGCYALHAQRMLAPWTGGAPRLTAARGGERPGFPGLDEWLEADLAFPGGATGSARCHMADDRWRTRFRVVGARGEATVLDFVRPDRDGRIAVRTPQGERVEDLGRRSSYTYQLEAFARRLDEGVPLPFGAEDALAAMRLIDECYLRAGFDPRPRS
ncbi:Gfo/Idh/MocA family protein [Nocardiopsis suaedae]|uniref:Gfo/Idh/MocA family oxidoreductase n=1 Tax=Nocardiopsis suaedae TaxID=3018444 RepID=A0ABT4TQA9_9ACTN|nr:Gfo/Idh/MocA family oxidoreductase [Nocardiopsis suaedae]MDA2806874.1 Gfo/Idh/MocA family oxidoreductase [Nocardiopsis suaedae]